jgi:hypothetical protein
MSYNISTLLLRNLSDVFGENDPVRRRVAIDEIFHEDAVFYARLVIRSARRSWGGCSTPGAPGCNRPAGPLPQATTPHPAVLRDR